MNIIVATILLALALVVRAHDLEDDAEAHGIPPPDYDYYCYQQLHLEHGHMCVVVSGEGRDSDVYLDDNDCAGICPPDEHGLMHIAGTKLCLQVGIGHLIGSSARMRAYPCDKHNKSQQFTRSTSYSLNSDLKDDFNHGHYNPYFVLKLKSYDKYCTTNRGRNADKGDPVVLKKCRDLYPEERKYWYFE